MSMPISGDTGKIDWSKILDDAFKGSGVDGADKNASIVLDGDNVVVTVRDPASGKEVSSRVSLPELKEGSEEAAVYDFLLNLADVCDENVERLKALADELGEPETTADGGENTPVDDETRGTQGAQETERTSAQKTIFSIYDLISMMQECAQKQRNAAREIRFQELENQKSSIEAQAQYQRDAAFYGMIVSAVTSAVQIGMAVGTTVAGVKGIQKMDTCSVGQDINQAKADIKTLENANNAEAAGARVTEIEGKCKIGQKDAVSQRLAACGDAKGAYEKAQTNYNDKLGAKTEIESKLGAVEEKLKSPNLSEPEKNALMETKGNRTRQLQTAENDLATAKTQLDSAKTDYVKALDTAMAEMDADYEKASAETKDAEGQFVKDYDEHAVKSFFKGAKNTLFKDTSEKTATQNAQLDLGNQRSLMKAEVVKAKAEMGVETKGTEMDAARVKLANATDAAKMDKGMRLAESSSGAVMAVQQLTQSVGSLGQGIAQYVQARTEAKATEEQATQKTQEQYRDETNQLFTQAQEVINNIRSLLAAVVQAESQTMQQIIRA